MKTSGLVLDVYDDFQGDILRSIYPTQGDIPEQVKVAHVLTHEETTRLPDEVFALALVDNGQVLRKYACIDSGNTTLAVEFFLKTAHKLPVEAQKVAASNLVNACEMYELEVPEALQKIAFVNAALNAMQVMGAVGQAPGQISQGLAENRMLGGGGHVITPAERGALKLADLNGSVDMPLTGPTGKTTAPAKTTILKSAAGMGKQVVGHGGQEEMCPDDNVTMGHKEQPDTTPQSKGFKPHVDVTNKAPPVKSQEKKASVYAMPSIQRYPLDSYSQVLTAVEYFDKYASVMAPEQKREFGYNLVKRASELGITPSNEVRQYGATTYAPEEAIKVGYVVRKNSIDHSPELSALLNALYEKRASIDPELFAETLGEFDKIAHLDFGYAHGIPDPFISTFGVKEAQEWSEVIGNDVVTEQDLRRLGKIGMRALKSTFSEDFAMDFKKDPVGIFQSLPRDQKRIIMRMATDNSGPGIELVS